jgi:hypothetical protein
MPKTFVITDNSSVVRFKNSFQNGLIKPTIKGKLFFRKLSSIVVDVDLQQQFRREGKAGGPRKIPSKWEWPKFSENTLKTKAGTPRIRYGTDKKPKRTREELAKYKADSNIPVPIPVGKMKGYRSQRRYSDSSKLMQASGSFRRSFGTIKITNKVLEYGTKHPLRKKIGKWPRRRFLFVTDQDNIRYANVYKRFYKESLKFE